MVGVADRVRDVEARVEDSLLFKGVEIIGIRGELIIANVPVEKIDRTEMPVDPNHVRELTASMEEEANKGVAGSTGQLSPILLGIIEGRPTFAIVDGFHRDAALAFRGVDTILATIPPTMTEDELLDLRVITANMHETVSFARINRLVMQAWANTPWVNRMKPHQAFALAASKTMTGRALDLTEEEASDIREWAKTRSVQWHMTPANIQIILSTALFAAPDLTDAVRKRSGGSQLETITQQHLGAISKAYPDQHGIQRALAGVIIENNLTTIEAKEMLESLNDADPDPVSLITKILTTDWGTRFGKGLKRAYTKKDLPASPVRQKLSTDSGYSSAVQLDQKDIPTRYLIAQVGIARLTLENEILKGQFVASPIGDTHVADFRIDYLHFDSFRHELRPVSGEASVERVVARLEEIQPQLLDMFYKRNLSPEEANRAINTMGQRISRDIDAGVLKHVSIKSTQIIDNLINAMVESVMGEVVSARPAMGSYTPLEQPTFKLEKAVRVNGEVSAEARVALALVGLMGANNHSIIQIMGRQGPQHVTAVRRRLEAVG